MPDKDNPKIEEQAHRPHPDTHAADTERLINTLDRVFSTFREQLQSEVPKPLTHNAKIAVDTFNDIVAGLRFESRRPGAITIEATHVSPTEIDLKWTSVAAADGYRVERCQGSNCADLEKLTTLPATARSFRDSNLSERSPYRYRVVAFGARGETGSGIVEVPPGNRRYDNRESR